MVPSEGEVDNVVVLLLLDSLSIVISLSTSMSSSGSSMISFARALKSSSSSTDIGLRNDSNVSSVWRLLVGKTLWKLRVW